MCLHSFIQSYKHLVLINNNMSVVDFIVGLLVLSAVGCMITGVVKKNHTLKFIGVGLFVALVAMYFVLGFALSAMNG
jgi:hypothetical protein